MGAFADLEQSVQTALETYSNVHRGSGHNSMVSTQLYEQAREIVLEYLGLNQRRDVVVFATPRRAETLTAQLKPGSYQSLSSQDIGLPLGVQALAVKQSALPKGIPFQSGGGTARLVSPGSVIWAHVPDRFEAGTPAIVNVIAFARALQLTRQSGNDAFKDGTAEPLSPADILCRDDLEPYAGRELLDELRKTLIGRDVRVPTMEGIRPYVNLDNGASTPTFAPIWEAVRQTWHQPAQVQQAIVQEVKSICAGFLGASPKTYDVIFMSNTTEVINLVAESLRGEAEPEIETVVVNTLLEHNSNELPWRTIPGAALIRLPVDPEGFIDLNEFEALLRAYNDMKQHGAKRIKLVAVSGASNVLGVFNDLASISRIAHQYGAKVLVDAAQLVAHRKVEMEKCGIDYLAFSAHKAYAPFGTGVLVARKGLLHFSPAEWEMIRASGEENVGGIAALGKALLLLQRIGLDVIQAEEQDLTRRTLRGLAQIPDLTIYGIQDPDSPQFAQKGGVIVFDLKGRLPNRVARRLAERGGIGVRSGCHCAHLLIKYLIHLPPFFARLQAVLLKVIPKLSLPGVVRVSLGIENTPEDVDTFIRVLGIIASQTQRGAPPSSAGSYSQTSVVSQADVQRQMNDFVQAIARRVYA